MDRQERPVSNLRKSFKFVIRWLYTFPVRIFLIIGMLIQIFEIVLLVDWNAWILSPPGTGGPDMTKWKDWTFVTTATVYLIFSILMGLGWIICLILNAYPPVGLWLVVAEGLKDIPMLVSTFSRSKTIYRKKDDEWDRFSSSGLLWVPVVFTFLFFGIVLLAYANRFSLNRWGLGKQVGLKEA
ncbi:hypothetical protein H072_6150 [Dactylellina haptotyla CBS 200.50]|uniref:Uncharacterized protein n=1 Tax=Dactylellina haptotyla (strain CBS 200.50) TaxID=1284197 RepID=S8AFU8_DACHA|nr:hypothetical protein H072_6150 [Dactylellina haptotyla CBS 200.50]